MINISDKEKCCGCGACAASCPVKCIEMTRDGQGFFYPAADAARCTGCGKCDSVCPVPIWDEKENKPLFPDAFAAYSKNPENRMQSSSGGLFGEIADMVLSDGGIVFGAVYDGVSSVRHTAAVSEDGIAPMRGSKYVESDLRGVFGQVLNELDNGKEVLFSGTPCQIAGLKAFLGREYERLFCLSFICNSVASPAVLGEYISDIEARKKKRAVAVTFRDKSTGWLNYASSFAVTLEDGEIYREKGGECLFKTALVNRIITRPICSVCPFRKYERAADITLGDFWGIEKIYPELCEPTGTSLAIVSTKKGAAALSSLSGKIELHGVELEKALTENPAFCRQYAPHPSRDMFWAKHGKKNTTAVMRDCLSPSFKDRLKRHLMPIIKRK